MMNLRDKCSLPIFATLIALIAANTLLLPVHAAAEGPPPVEQSSALAVPSASVTSPGTPSETPAPPPFLAPRAPEAQTRLQLLLRERDEVLSRRVSLATPITLMTVGAVLSIVGFSVLTPSSEVCDEPYGSCTRNGGLLLASYALGLSGSVLAIVGTAILPSRIVRRARRRRDLQRIDGELSALGMRVSLAPTWALSGGKGVPGWSAAIRF
ncbi:MAG: hypothetical protein RLZZ450_1611 [Pseudomonadota bacterium]|jgi:hypothetical protein